PWWIKSSANAMPNAVTVRGSSGGSPATPRMPSVPKSFFAMWSVISSNVNLHCNLWRVHKTNFRLRNENGQVPLEIGCRLAEVYGIGDGVAGGMDAALRPGNGQ